MLLREKEGMRMPVRTLHRILQRHQLLGQDFHAPALQRFERAKANELWQMDTKGHYPEPRPECHPLSIVDDHSRYLVGLYALARLSCAQAWSCLVDSFRRYGLPQAILMDRGTLWWSVHNGWGLTRLSVRLIEQGIQLQYGRICHPQTRGKVERFHRTLGIEVRHRGLPAQWAEWPSLLSAIQRGPWVVSPWRSFPENSLLFDPIQASNCAQNLRRFDFRAATHEYNQLK